MRLFGSPLPPSGTRQPVRGDVLAGDRPWLPYPSGWFCVGFSRELPAGRVITRRFMGEDVVVYRTRAGAVRAVRPYCPHLGAHLGVGGTVEGELLVCPFHRFAFDPDGVCTKVPGGRPPRARLDHYPVREQNGIDLPLARGGGARVGAARDRRQRLRAARVLELGTSHPPPGDPGEHGRLRASERAARHECAQNPPSGDGGAISAAAHAGTGRDAPGAGRHRGGPAHPTGRPRLGGDRGHPAQQRPGGPACGCCPPPSVPGGPATTSQRPARPACPHIFPADSSCPSPHWCPRPPP